MRVAILPISILCSMLFITSCASPVLDDPCAASERPVSAVALLENSLSGSYESCLDSIRRQSL